MSDGGLTVAMIKIFCAYLIVCSILYVPLIFIKIMEIRSGDPLWLGHKLFGKDSDDD